MASETFPEHVRQLIFEHIDSVEQLEVLLFMRAHRDKTYEAKMISSELRSNTQSVLNRLLALEACCLVTQDDLHFRYEAKTPELEDAVLQLSELYKVRPHKVLELIFSPLKKGRHFAEAFVVHPVKGTSKKGSENG